MMTRQLIVDGLRLMRIGLAIVLCVAVGLIVVLMVELSRLAAWIFALPLRLLGRGGK